jgi:hypothetical protein
LSPPRFAFAALAPFVIAVLTAVGARAQGQTPPAPAPGPAPQAPMATAQTPAPVARPLGKLEQESVEDALSGLGLKIDPQPQGKTIGSIYSVNQEVFSRRDWWFQFFNHFHRTTRPDILTRELLLKPGQPYDQALVEESTRNLQAPPVLVLPTGATFIPPELSSVVAIVPVVSPTPGQVDLLAVTRDVWSLRFNTNFEFQQSTLSSLDTSLSENNLFGWRKYLAARFSLDLGKYGAGPTYFDPNIAGTRLTFLASATAYYARDTDKYEGNSETFALTYPLYSLASRWGAGVDVSHQNAVIRAFQGTSLAQVMVPGASTNVDYIFRRSFLIVDANAVRSFGSYVIQRATFGYRFDDRQSSLLDGFSYAPATPADLQLFLSQVAPITERRSEPYVQYDMFTARYAVYRDLDTFDLRENVRLGPSLTLRAAYGAPELGADRRAYPLSGTAGWVIGPGGALLSASVTGTLRFWDGNAIDQRGQAKAYAASPMLKRLVRLVVAGEIDSVRDDSARTIYFLGGDTGLRGYAIGEFHGSTMFVAHAEVRSAPLAIYSQRVGVLVFYDVGHAANSVDALVPHQDVGAGIRWLIPQANSYVLRADWAVPLQNGDVTPAGFPGRISAGFQQIF